MPDPHQPGPRTPAQRVTDHASLARLSDTLVPALVAKLSASGLGELEVREGDWRIRLRRPVGGIAAAPVARRPERPRLAAHGPDRETRAREGAGAGEPRATGAGAAAGRPGVSDPSRSIAASPAVGVFRPDVALGAKVRAGDRIGVVDLLGIPQDVTAPVDGIVADILVAAGDAVEYGEPIAALEPDPAATIEPADPDAGGEG